MKRSKLKFLVALVALVVVTAVTSTVQAVSYGHIKISDLEESRANAHANIVPGGSETEEGEPSGPKYTYVAVVNTKNDSEVVAVKTDSTITNAYTAAYGTHVANLTGSFDLRLGTDSETDKRIGLAVQLYTNANREVLEAGNVDLDAYSAAQAYIWAANSGFSGDYTGNLSENAKIYYNSFASKINAALTNPSFYGQTIELKWSAANQRYEEKVIDTNGVLSSALTAYNLSADSRIHWIQNGNEITFYTTETIGSKANPLPVNVTKTVNSGYYKPAYVNFGGVDVVMTSGDRYPSTTGTLYVYSNSLKIQVTKTLNLHDANKPGDATPAGAVYGVYKDAGCTQLVQTITIGEDGTATTDALEDGTYWVKETTASDGCKIDTTVYKSTNYTEERDANGQRIVKIGSNEDVIYGAWHMVISSSDLSGNTTKLPSAGSKVQLVHKASGKVYDTQVANERGEVSFQDIPYGEYELKESEKVGEDLDYMDPIHIAITSETDTEFNGNSLVNSQVAQRRIQIFVQDKDSEKLIVASHGKFEIYKDGVKLSQYVTYSPSIPDTPKNIDVFETDENGWLVTPRELPYGTYTIKEIESPNGYYRDQVNMTVNIETNTAENPEEKPHAKVTFKQSAQKIALTITARGNAFTSAAAVEEQPILAKYGVKNFVQTTVTIPGVVYTITPKADVVDPADGSVQWVAGKGVDYTTDANGKIVEELPLGSYEVAVKSVPAGYILPEQAETVEVTTLPQTVRTQAKAVNTNLELQQYEVKMNKEFGEGTFYRTALNEETSTEDHAYTQVVFGIYAAEEITGTTGTKLASADELVKVVRVTSDGSAELKGLPMGNYYVKELECDRNYEISEQKEAVACVPADTTTALFTVEAKTIVNMPLKVTKFTIEKVEVVDLDKLNGEATPGALVQFLSTIANALTQGAGLQAEDETVLTLKLAKADFEVLYKAGDDTYFPVQEKINGILTPVVRTTDEEGTIVIEGLPYGDYRIREIKAPEYYELNDKVYDFTLDEANKEEKRIVEDERATANINLAIEDEDGNVLENATIELVDNDNDQITYVLTTDEEGKAEAEVRQGKYTVKVKDLADQYVAVADRTVEVKEDTEVETIVAKFVTGSILIVKVDSETGAPVPGTKFMIFSVVDPEEGTLEEVEFDGELVTDENGQILAEGLRYGDYVVRETEAAKDYELNDEDFYVVIHEDGVVMTVEVTNVFTGDIAVALYAVLALVSVAAITTTVKKMKRN